MAKEEDVVKKKRTKKSSNQEKQTKPAVEKKMKVSEGKIKVGRVKESATTKSPDSLCEIMHVGISQKRFLIS